MALPLLSLANSTYAKTSAYFMRVSKKKNEPMSFSHCSPSVR
jgi:hypothetical protein